MNNKPICGEWHGNDVMPNGNKLCIFEIKVGETSEILIGYRQCDTIVRESCDCEFQRPLLEAIKQERKARK